MLTTRRLNDIAARLWDTGFRYGGWFLTWAAVWLVAITLLGLWIPGTAVATLAIVVPLGIAVWFVVRYIWWPTGPTVIAANEFVKKVSKIDLAMLVVAVLAITLGWGLFVAYYPIEDGPQLLVPFVGLVILAIFLRILGMKKLSWVAAIIAVLVMLNVPAEGTFGTPAAQTTSATEQSGRTETVRYLVELKGDDILSDVAVVMEDIPPGITCPFEGPISTQVHFDDGTVGFITGESFGVKSGPVRFTGPAGEMAGLVCSI